LVDQFNTLGLGENIPIVTGTSSDSLQAFKLRHEKMDHHARPYPMGFFSRGMDGRIDQRERRLEGTRRLGHLRRGHDCTSKAAQARKIKF